MYNNIYDKKTKILLVGESGSGKDTVKDFLVNKYNLKPLLSYTTRPKRFKEENTHTFIDLDEYYHCKSKNNIIAETYYNENYYFATEEQLLESDVYVIDFDGIKYLKSHSNIPFIVFYLNVPESERINRMKIRGDSDQEIQARIDFDKKAFKDNRELVDYIITNRNSEISADDIYKLYTHQIQDTISNEDHLYICKEIMDKICQIQTLLLKLSPDTTDIAINMKACGFTPLENDNDFTIACNNSNSNDNSIPFELFTYNNNNNKDFCTFAKIIGLSDRDVIKKFVSRIV